MKKVLALVLVCVMALGLGACAVAEEAGFKEYDLGAEGEQTVGFMTMSMVYFQPVDMAPADLANAKEKSDLHIEVDLTANQNDYAFPVDQWVPYLNIDFVINDKDGKEVTSGSMMPMAASDGPHYGNNIALPEGEGYSITLTIKAPSAYLLHVDEETGVAAKEWFEPLTATWTDWTFQKEW